MGKKDIQRQLGSALVTVLSLSVAILLIGALSSQIVRDSRKDTQKEFQQKAQASNIARAGLKDAVGWFKLQVASGGPVSNMPPYSSSFPCADSAFNPQYHSDPKLRETIAPSVGIVKDIVLDESRNLYGRYIVKKQPCGTGADPDITPDESSYESFAAHDVTHLRSKGVKGSGLVWQLSSEGIVYIRRNKARDGDGVFTTSPEDEPNQILAREYVGVDINRLNMAVPLAPIVIMDPIFGNDSQSSFNGNCKVTGSGALATLVYGNVSGAQNPSGNPACQYNDCSGGRSNKRMQTNEVQDPMMLESVFGVASKSELRSLADDVFQNVNELKSAYFRPSGNYIDLPMSLYYLDGNFTFSDTLPLRGSGLLFVDGDLTLNANSFGFNGVVYVTGELIMRDNNSITGAAFANRVNCTPSVKADFEYSPSMIRRVRDAIALYRENTVTFREGK